MGFATRIIVVGSVALTAAMIAPAGPPGGGGGRSFGGPISGPAPVGASGPAPVHASGSLIGNPYSGAGYRGGGNHGGYAPGGYTRSYNDGRSNRGDVRSGSTHRGDRRDYRHLPAALFFSPYYYPSLDYGSAPYDGGYDDSYDQGPGPADPSTQFMLESQGQLGQQVRHLTSEIEQLREQQNQGGSPYVMSPPSAPDSQPPQNAVPVTLVLHGGKTLKVKDYAVVNGVLWDFTAQPARKIALSNVDVEASAKATQAEGGEFPDLSPPPEN